jgi:predicted AAA+ superfamily ATPase
MPQLDRSCSVFQQSEPGSQPYFWRTAQGHEIDLLIDLGAKKIPFEIKLHSAPTASDVAVFRQCLQQLNLPHGYLIHSGRENYSLGNGVTALSAEHLLSHPQSLIGNL